MAQKDLPLVLPRASDCPHNPSNFSFIKANKVVKSIDGIYLLYVGRYCSMGCWLSDKVSDICFTVIVGDSFMRLSIFC
jgi:hypothetical protein